MKHDKTCGLDRVPTEVLKHLGDWGVCVKSPTHHPVDVGLHAQPGLSGHITLTSIIYTSTSKFKASLFSTRPSDRAQIWHACVDRDETGSHQKN